MIDEAEYKLTFLYYSKLLRLFLEHGTLKLQLNFQNTDTKRTHHTNSTLFNLVTQIPTEKKLTTNSLWATWKSQPRVLQLENKCCNSNVEDTFILYLHLSWVDFQRKNARSMHTNRLLSCHISTPFHQMTECRDTNRSIMLFCGFDEPFWANIVSMSLFFFATPWRDSDIFDCRVVFVLRYKIVGTDN